jgi:hypothetical protein
VPFKSKAQQRFMFAAEDRGEIPKGTAERWADHTPDIKGLPEKKKKKKDDKDSGTKKKAMLVCLVQKMQKNATHKLAFDRIGKRLKKKAAVPPQPISPPVPSGPYQGPAAPPFGGAPAAGMPPVAGAGAMGAMGAMQMQPNVADSIAKSIGQFGATERGRAAYERLAQSQRGTVRGYAAASQPDAKKRLQAALGSAAPKGGGMTQTASAERVGTPFMDGFLRFCMEKELSGDQVADLLEKTAERKDRAGGEARGLIERMLKLN